ncbi:MAG: hypothetical protein LBV66_02010 [Elusimicrobiota bacterium]|jgi:LPS-assembly protein|nr:hypothetical protein [Elusimicrobiota bacterium]
MKKILLQIILIFILFFFKEFVFAYDIDINADSLEYNQESNTILAFGNVHIKWEDTDMYADSISFVFENKMMTAEGNVQLKEEGNIVFAQSISYYYDDEKGELIKTKAASNAAFIQSEKMERLDKENFAVHRISISNCDLDEPHTSFRASKAKLINGKRVTLYNAILYIGDVPVFYIPILTRALVRGKEPFTITVEPGYSQEGGFLLKTTLGYYITENLKNDLFIDYLGKYGFGYGTQFDYFTSRTKASIYAYNIDDEINKMQRWAVKPYLWSQIGDFWTLRSQAELISDPGFNNIYNRADWNRISNNPQSYASITRSDNNSNLMILAEEYKEYNEEEKKFETETLSLPKVSYMIYPKKLFWDISSNFDAEYNNFKQDYSANKNLFFKNTANVSEVIAKNFNINPRLTLTPSFGIEAGIVDKDDFDNTDYASTFTYTSGLNSRLRLSNWMDWNFQYTISAISEKNSIEIDTNRNDYGIVNESLGYTNYAYIGNNATLRNFVSYDLRRFKTKEETRWSPVENELTWLPKSEILIYIRQVQEVDPSFKFQSLQSEISIGNRQKLYFNIGIFYQDFRRDDIDNAFGFGIWLTPKWRFEYDMKTTMNFKTQDANINEHELKLYRDLHCYNLGFTWRVRRDIYQGYIHETFVMFNLKTNMPFNRASPDSERIFYPWL